MRLTRSSSVRGMQLLPAGNRITWSSRPTPGGTTVDVESGTRALGPRSHRRRSRLTIPPPMLAERSFGLIRTHHVYADDGCAPQRLLDMTSTSTGTRRELLRCSSPSTVTHFRQPATSLRHVKRPRTLAARDSAKFEVCAHRFVDSRPRSSLPLNDGRYATVFRPAA